jgi:dephospho-CoA kinase
VICPEEQESARLLARSHLSEEEAWTCIRAQPPVAHKLALVDEVIDNGGSLEETRRQVVAAFERFCRRLPA